MNQNERLLEKIAEQYGIYKGVHENECIWKARVIYSICGLMAYTSLWDEPEEEPISIIHLKRRILSIFSSYREIYPETSLYVTHNSDELTEEIARLFLNCGIVYHCPNRIAPTKYTAAAVGDVIFQRGINIDAVQQISGIGFYAKQEVPITTSIHSMFDIETNPLTQVWEYVTKNAVWTDGDEASANQYFLRTTPPFTQGYWVNQPAKNGMTSLMRTCFPGTHLYYLYKYEDDQLKISQLPSWQVEEQQYRMLANACLRYNGTLPAISYSIDGKIVHIDISYLLPPREQLWLELYSWPKSCVSLPHSFHRVCTYDIFYSIKTVLSDAGYTFTER